MATIISKPSNEKYREEYDRIFENKEQDPSEKINIRKKFEEETGQKAFVSYSPGPSWEYCLYLEKKLYELMNKS